MHKSPTASYNTAVPVKQGTVIKPTQPGGNPPPAGSDRVVGPNGDWVNGPAPQ